MDVYVSGDAARNSSMLEIVIWLIEIPLYSNTSLSLSRSLFLLSH